MARRNALSRNQSIAQDPVHTIPLAQGRRRSNRAWDRENRGCSYYIPSHLRDATMEIRSSILGLSRTYMASTSNVALALISFSLSHVRQGRLVINAHPNATRRKMTLTWDEVASAAPQEISIPKKGKSKTQEIYINYRWGGDVKIQIAALSGSAISKGELVLFLLAYAIEAYKIGNLRLREETVVVSQKVMPTW